MQDLRQVFDRGFHTVLAGLMSQGVVPAGPPFALYHQVSTELVDTLSHGDMPEERAAA